ncbi:unnamed protein product [Thlaspi arvense]|uniref:DCD domain-containing protein n=1 Tax=Thlaspi arvense TaxID=13288 RepID=A0AAU9S3Y7_THLAR|nr:unnamed protein product [Thlaspi arvense]
MPKYRRTNLLEEPNGASGEEPEFGAIFMSNSSTRKECLRRGLFGLPMGQAGFVKQVKAGMLLFLFEFESRELHGVFQACSDGAINIEPYAFCSSGKQFPAQVKFNEKWRCRPLTEMEFRHAISDNYFTPKKFNFGLSKAQVQRLLKLFSLKKVEGSRLRKTAVAKPTRKSESRLGNTAGVRGFRNRCSEETDGDVDREFPSRVTSAGDLRGRRVTENYGFRDESDIGLETKEDEYSRDASGVFRRLVDPKMHGSKDRVGCDFSMNNGSVTDGLTHYSEYPLANDRRAPENLKHTASGWLRNEYHENGGIIQASSWSNNEEHLNTEADPVVPAQSSVPRESLYRTNTEHYDPCNPGIMGDATMKSSRYDRGAPNAGSVGSASFTDNPNYVFREEYIPVGGYVSDALPSEAVQPFPDEHNGSRMNKTSSLGLDYYIPMPTEHPQYQPDTGMTGVACPESESESRYAHLRHSQFPGFLNSAEATENMRNSERDSSQSIVPSFAYPLSSRDLSPKYGVNNETSAYQHQGEFEGHVSYSNDMVVHDSRIYPSFTHSSTSGDGVDLYTEKRAQNRVQDYQRHEKAFDTNNRMIREDLVNPAELERRRTRKSVFSRLAMPAVKRDAEKETSSDTESVDEVMAFLNDCHKHWMGQKRANMNTPGDFGKPKEKKEKTLTTEMLDADLMLPFTETTPDELLDCEESMEHSPKKRPFIDFKRRSKVQKTSGSPTQGCSKESPGHSAPQGKKRKLVRPKLIEDDSEKDKGNNDNPTDSVLASQSASDVPVPDLLGSGDQ